MRRIKVLGLGFVLLLASFLPAVASAREYETTGATVVVQYYDGGYYGYRDRDDYYRHYHYYRRHRAATSGVTEGTTIAVGTTGVITTGTITGAKG